MSPTGAERIIARDIYDYCISPFMVYCEKFGPVEKKDLITEFDQMLFEQGKLHENQVIKAKYPGTEKTKYKSLEEGFKLLLEGMKNGSSAICGAPAFYLPEGLTGIFDVIEKRKGAPSIFGSYHYVVKEIKLARNMQNYHIFQGAFYNYLLGKIQGYTPPAFYLINRDHEELVMEYDKDRLLEIVGSIREILKGAKVSPTYGACLWPWETYNDEEAIRTRDVSLVSGIGPSHKKRLSEEKILTVEDLASTSKDNLLTMKGIGEKTATKFLNNSKALVTNKHIRIGQYTFPAKETEIFLDLEGTGEQVTEEELVAIDYLIGILVRKNGEQTYIPFVAHGLDQEEKMFNDFAKWILKQKECIIYHWHNYERTHLEKMSQRHNLSRTKTEKIFENMRDLYKDAVSSFAFPTYGNGLKQIAAYIGHNWKHKDVNAMESMALYFQYIQDPVKNKDKLQKIIDYNKDDCVATLMIKDWLEQQSKQ